MILSTWVWEKVFFVGKSEKLWGKKCIIPKKYWKEQSHQKRDAWKKAVARKKELELIRHEEMETKNTDEDSKIEKAKQQIEETNIKNKPKNN